MAIGKIHVCSVEMLYYITMCQLTILYSFRLRLVSHLYSVDSPVCFFSSSIIIGSLISDFITLYVLFGGNAIGKGGRVRVWVCLRTFQAVTA